MPLPALHSKPPTASGFGMVPLVFLVLLLGTVLFLRKPSPSACPPEETARDASRLATLAALQAEDHAKLTTFAWIDRSQNRVQIPLAAAMQLVLADLPTRKPAPAYPILDTAGQPLPEATPSTAFSEPADPLPAEQDGEAQISSNVLSAPVEPPAKKTTKVKKPAKKAKKRSPAQTAK